MRFEFLAPGFRPRPLTGRRRRSAARSNGPIAAGRGVHRARRLASRQRLRGSGEGGGGLPRPVGIADLAFLGKLELQAEPAVVSSIVSQLAGGAALAPGQAALHDGTWWCPMSPSRVLALTPPEATAAVRDGLEEADRSGSVRLGRRDHRRLGLQRRRRPARARGARSHDGARHASEPVRGGCVRAGLGRAHSRPDPARARGSLPPSFGAGYAQYTWTVFVDAAESLGGRAVGIEALRGGDGRQCVTSSESAGCGVGRPSSATATTSSSSAAARTGSRSPTTLPASTGSPTSPFSSRAISAPAPPGAIRRSCARTTRRPRGRASTTPR